MFDTAEGPVRAILVAVQLPDVDAVAFQSSVAELGRLARTLGVEVAGQIVQRRAALHPGTVLGKGKIVELPRMVGGGAGEGETGLGDEDEDEDGTDGAAGADDDADEAAEGREGAVGAVQAVLVDHELTPSQARNLEKLTGI